MIGWTEASLEKLIDVIREVHSQHADDLCWMPADVNRIFAAAGLPPQDLRVGDTEAMLANCQRYVACLQKGGSWKSYAELEAENARLRKALESYRDVLNEDEAVPCDMDAGGVWLDLSWSLIQELAEEADNALEGKS